MSHRSVAPLWMQKLPSAVSRLPLPAEVEGYTMMYEPPLHTPSPPRPNTSQANGSGTGNGSGLEASGYVSPPPVPCLQVDAPQQEDVFRASEVRGDTIYAYTCDSGDWEKEGE